MASKNSPLNYTSFDLEREAISRFRSLAPFLPPECRIFRKIEQNSPVLCLDFTACPQELVVNRKELEEWAFLLALSSHYLGLASSIVFKIDNQVIVQMNLTEII